jgi:hypothetical protein
MIGTNLAITPKRFAPLGSSNDADAQAFITAAGITNPTQQSAVNQLVLDLKSANIWTKMKAIYPIVGGSASTHKWNLKDPRDLNAAFRLSFSTGWTHSINGMTPNGSSAYADTFLTPSTSLSLNSSHISFYSRTNNTADYSDFGAGGVGSSNTNYLQILSKWSDSKFYGLANDVDFTANTVTTSTGLFIVSRTGVSASKNYKDGSIITTKTASSVSLSDRSLVLSARNLASGGLSNYSNRQCAFASIGDGLTDTEAANFYTAVQNYNTTLGRQV